MSTCRTKMLYCSSSSSSSTIALFAVAKKIDAEGGHHTPSHTVHVCKTQTAFRLNPRRLCVCAVEKFTKHPKTPPLMTQTRQESSSNELSFVEIDEWSLVCKAASRSLAALFSSSSSSSSSPPPPHPARCSCAWCAETSSSMASSHHSRTLQQLARLIKPKKDWIFTHRTLGKSSLAQNAAIAEQAQGILRDCDQPV